MSTTTTPIDWTTASWPATVTGLQLLLDGGCRATIRTPNGDDHHLDFPEGHPTPNLGEALHLTLTRGAGS